MSEINLLPIDLSPSKGSAKTASSLKKAIVVLFSVFLIFVVAGIALILFLSTQVQSLSKEEATTTQKIQSLQQTEQTIFVLKDRVAKIKIANSNTQTNDSFVLINQALTNLPANVSVDTIAINSASTQFSVVSKDSLGMASFLNNIIASQSFKNLILKSFEFSPETGFTIKLQIS